MSELSWSLVVATVDRPQVLRRCIECALRQTRPPLEVVIVDASANGWASQAEVSAELATRAPSVALQYVRARRRSLTAQRNQGIAIAHGDVVFLIDDDSFMHADCAAEVMRVYEGDEGRRVAGVSPMLADLDPAVVQHCDAPPTEASNTSVRRVADRLRSLLDIERMLLPYDSEFPEHHVEHHLDLVRCNAEPVRFLHGMRMTFRREVIARVGFDESLIGYGAAEDLDASYRASRHGAMLLALGARIYHARHERGRLTRFTRAALASINLGALYCLKSHDPDAALRTLLKGLRRRAWVDLCVDLGRGRWDLPTFRGDLFGCRMIVMLRRRSRCQVRAWFATIQAKLIERNDR